MDCFVIQGGEEMDDAVEKQEVPAGTSCYLSMIRIIV